jgi:hypothetical protein
MPGCLAHPGIFVLGERMGIVVSNMPERRWPSLTGVGARDSRQEAVEAGCHRAKSCRHRSHGGRRLFGVLINQSISSLVSD